MAIFIGNAKNSTAVKAALNISWAVEEVIRPALKAKWPGFNWVMRHGVGIDSGEALLVRGGVHGNNDIVSIGGAPNIAAKLSDIRTGRSIYISEPVYLGLNEESKYANGVDMWTRLGVETFGGKLVPYYGSSYRWAP
jgi:class 3 adenylate cyclase